MMTLNGALSTRRFSRPTHGRGLGQGPLAGLGGLAGALLALLYLWQSRYEERRALSEMDPRLLRDIGLNREAADQEAGKPFWQA